MRRTVDILFDVTGQALEHRALQGRPTSATFDVFWDFAADNSAPEFSGTATVDSVSTTVSSASGRSQSDPQRINLTSTASIVTGRKYLLSEDARREWVEPIEIGTGYIRVRHQLAGDFTTAATFVGTTVTATVDATWVAAEENISDHIDPNPDYRVRWEYAVAGATYIEYSFFDLVRATVGPQVDIDDVNERAPGLRDSLPIEYQAEQGRPLIDAAWRALQAHLAVLKIDTDAIRDHQILDEMIVMKALQILAIGGWRPAGYETIGDYIETTSTQFDRFLEQHFKVTANHRLATGTGGGSNVVYAPPIWAK